MNAILHLNVNRLAFQGLQSPFSPKTSQDRPALAMARAFRATQQHIWSFLMRRIKSWLSALCSELGREHPCGLRDAIHGCAGCAQHNGVHRRAHKGLTSHSRYLEGWSGVHMIRAGTWSRLLFVPRDNLFSCTAGKLQLGTKPIRTCFVWTNWIPVQTEAPKFQIKKQLENTDMFLKLLGKSQFQLMGVNCLATIWGPYA